jgi:methyl-accepting chemotaxis protein
MADKLDVAYNQRLKLSQELGSIDSSLQASVGWLWASHSADTDLNERKKYTEKTRKEIKDIDASLEKYIAIPKSAKATEILIKSFIPNWDSAKKIYEEINLQLEKTDNNEAAKAKVLITAKLRPMLNPLRGNIDELQEIAIKTNANLMAESLEYAHSVKTISILVVTLGGLISFFICIRIASQLVQILSSLSSELNNASTEVSAAAIQIASSAEQLSNATIEQAASLEETSSSIQEMSAMVAKNSENSEDASNIARDSQLNAVKGKAAVDNMIDAINEITDANNSIMKQINSSNQEISEIVKMINEIGAKTKVIDDIVFQTKLLSFNASVEAARAGEQGRGFAVVAEEVGKLAQMSGKAAGEIKEMLESSIYKVESIVTNSKTSIGKLIQEGKNKIELGTKTAKQCGEVLDEIVISISTVNDKTHEISSSSKEQSQGVGEITKAMHQINSATQQNSAGATQSASAAEELSAQASMLKNAVKTLIVTIDG